ncbi:hypothetical protein SLEP1_g7837 [Rubroshorea leprosula]|uniref:Uncharacterized protein n=1 Tax=Rubroshorea leprosula TaxID=152421 RepID=A0AAV5I9M5_9ROSI|nr:hypothetical protein SLEP1_g7837 [Rubroshorea leprosula]
MEKPERVEGKVDWRGRTALKHKHGGMRTALMIIAAFGFENMANIALTVNLVTYFNGILHFELPDAANELTNYMGTSFFLTILVTVLTDTYIGRFKAVLFSGFIEFLGLALLTVQAHFPSLRPPLCNVFEKTWQCGKLKTGDAAFLFVALYLLAAGTAGFKAAFPTHGADQFDEKGPKETRQMSSLFNWLLLALCIGGAVSLTLIVWIQDERGWDWGFGISTVTILCGVIPS